MTKFIPLTTMLAILGCSSCTETVPPSSACADEYYEGSVTFPDGTIDAVCSPARSDGMQILLSSSPECRVLAGQGVSYGGGATWGVASPGEWFATLGLKELELGYNPLTLTASRCPTGVLGADCMFHRPGCQVEVTRAGHSDGDVIEGHLTASCMFSDPSVAGGTWTPTLTALRFRVRLHAQIVDAGATCSYP